MGEIVAGGHHSEGEDENFQLEGERGPEALYYYEGDVWGDVAKIEGGSVAS